MKKQRMAYALSATALVVGSGVFVPFGAFADDNVMTLESCEGIENCSVVTSTAELSDALDAEKTTIIVGASFDLTDDLYPSHDFTFYLNNYTISSDGLSFVPYGEMTIYAGDNGKIEETGGRWAPFYAHGNLILQSGTIETAGTAVYVIGEDVEFIMNGGTITGGSDSATTVITTDGAKTILNNGIINADTWGVSVFKDSEIIMNGGTINVSSEDGIGVSGNGSMSGDNEGTNAKLTLNAGIINSGDLGVYAPQVNGETILGSDLTINAGKCGVEVRAGELSVEGATINVDSEAPYVFNPNGNGSTASGVGVSVSQHTTKQAIIATISDGVITAPVAVGEANPQINPGEDISKVEMAITGGEFNATNGEPVVASEDVDAFIAGGVYNKIPDSEYVAGGYDIYDVSPDGPYYVEEETSVNLPEKLFLQVGESYGVVLSEIAEKYGTLGGANEIVTIDDENVITATAVGTGLVNFNLHNYIDPVDQNIDVTVYDVTSRTNDDSESAADRNTLEDFFAGQVAEALASENSTWYRNDKVEINISELKDILSNGDSLTSGLIVNDETAEQAVGYDELIAELNSDEEIAALYSITAALTNSDLSRPVGFANTLDEPITLRLAIPEEYTDAEGVFSVLRSHYDRSSQQYRVDRMPFTRDGNDLLVENDEFSTFAIAYADSQSTDPTEGGEATGTDSEATTSTTASPETGTMTREGASATAAALITSIVIGVLVSAVSFAVLIRKR